MSERSNQAWSLVFVVVVVAGGLIWLASMRDSFYVRMMDGPFTGLEFSGDLPAMPVSELAIAREGRLAAYELPEFSAPVLVLWAPNGDKKWSRLMKPIKRYADGSTKEAWLKELKLHEFRKIGEGVVVDITCNWEWGGHEGGRLYLDGQLNFREFKLSW